MIPTTPFQGSVVNHRKRRRRMVGAWLVALVGAAVAVEVLLAPRSPGELGGAFVLLALVGSLGLLALRRPGGVPVLNYHSVSDDPSWLPWGWGLSVTTEAFDRHLTLLERWGYRVIRTRDLVEARRAGRAVPPRSVVIQFDDGYLDNWVGAFPILRRHGVPATIFVSLDFIDPGTELRPRLDEPDRAAELRWDGYLNLAELRALEDSGLVDVESHGTDHGRVAVGPEVVDILGPRNWRRHAWVQWAAMEGNKSAWYRGPEPPAVPLGSPVRRSAGALVARAWSEGEGREDPDAYVRRVAAALRRARSELSEKLGREVTVLCWPENLVTPRARELAAEAGFLATTAGRGENRVGEDPSVISRTYCGDRPLGFRWAAADALSLRAKLGLASGNDAWYLLLAPMNAMRETVRALRRRREARER